MMNDFDDVFSANVFDLDDIFDDKKQKYQRIKRPRYEQKNPFDEVMEVKTDTDKLNNDEKNKMKDIFSDIF